MENQEHQIITYPAIFNQYTQIQEIGAGAYGKVFLYQKKGQDYAVKFEIHSVYQRALLHEALLLKNLSIDQNLDIVVKYHNHSMLTQDKLNYLVMEYLKFDLEAFFQEQIKKDPESKILILQDLMIKCIDVLRRFHEAEYVHRDIKPANFMIRDDKPVLIDFGISQEYKKYSQNQSLKRSFMQTPTIPGTLNFVSVKMHQVNQVYDPLDDLESLIYTFLWIINDQTLPWSNLVLYENAKSFNDEIFQRKQLFVKYDSNERDLFKQFDDDSVKVMQDYYEMNPLINKALQQALILIQTNSTNTNIDQQEKPLVDSDLEQQQPEISIYDQLKELIQNFTSLQEGEQVIQEEYQDLQIIEEEHKYQTDYNLDPTAIDQTMNPQSVQTQVQQPIQQEQEKTLQPKKPWYELFPFMKSTQIEKKQNSTNRQQDNLEQVKKIDYEIVYQRTTQNSQSSTSQGKEVPNPFFTNSHIEPTNKYSNSNQKFAQEPKAQIPQMKQYQIINWQDLNYIIHNYSIYQDSKFNKDLVTIVNDLKNALTEKEQSSLLQRINQILNIQQIQGDCVRFTEEGEFEKFYNFIEFYHKFFAVEMKKYIK
eukprot:403359885